jgi:hypothetical protein
MMVGNSLFPSPEPPTKGWEWLSNNDKDDPPASAMVPAAAYFLCFYDD